MSALSYAGFCRRLTLMHQDSTEDDHLSWTAIARRLKRRGLWTRGTARDSEDPNPPYTT